MEDTYTVGDLVAEFLEKNGVSDAFGIVSVHNIAILDAVGRRGRIRFVTARGEMGAAHMADAYARASGSPGVLITSTGPGAANAMGGLVEANFAGSPVLHLTGQTETRFAHADLGTTHHVSGQTAMLTAVCKASFRPTRSEDVLDVLRQAWREMVSAPQGPVTVEIPVDLQMAKIERPVDRDLASPEPHKPMVPSSADIDLLADRLKRAKRPMLWLGNGARGAAEEARALVEMGFGAVSSWNGRGIIAENHPATLGAMQGHGTPQIEEFYSTVDAMLVVGSKIRGMETRDFTLKLPSSLLHIDIDPSAKNRTYRSEIFVCGDAKLVLQGLLERLSGQANRYSGFHRDVSAVKTRVREEYAATLGPYATFAQQLQDVTPDDVVLVRDITIGASTWGTRLFQVLGLHSSIHPVGAAIGPGLPMGIGAAIAAARTGRKVVAIVGDGGFAMNMTELWTAAQENTDLCCIVLNDCKYGIIGHLQDAFMDGRRYFDSLKGPDLQALAAVAGIKSWKVSRAESFGAAVREALQRSGPTLVEVDMLSIGDFPMYEPLASLARKSAMRRETQALTAR